MSMSLHEELQHEFSTKYQIIDKIRSFEVLEEFKGEKEYKSVTDLKRLKNNLLLMVEDNPNFDKLVSEFQIIIDDYKEEKEKLGKKFVVKNEINKYKNDIYKTFEKYIGIDISHGEKDSGWNNPYDFGLKTIKNENVVLKDGNEYITIKKSEDILNSFLSVRGLNKKSLDKEVETFLKDKDIKRNLVDKIKNRLFHLKYEVENGLRPYQTGKWKPIDNPKKILLGIDYKEGYSDLYSIEKGLKSFIDNKQIIKDFLKEIKETAKKEYQQYFKDIENEKKLENEIERKQIEKEKENIEKEKIDILVEKEKIDINSLYNELKEIYNNKSNEFQNLKDINVEISEKFKELNETFKKDTLYIKPIYYKKDNSLIGLHKQLFLESVNLLIEINNTIQKSSKSNKIDNIKKDIENLKDKKLKIKENIDKLNKEYKTKKVDINKLKNLKNKLKNSISEKDKLLKKPIKNSEDIKKLVNEILNIKNLDNDINNGKYDKVIEKLSNEKLKLLDTLSKTTNKIKTKNILSKIENINSVITKIDNFSKKEDVKIDVDKLKNLKGKLKNKIDNDKEKKRKERIEKSKEKKEIKKKKGNRKGPGGGR